jgi:hypothetical protein
MSVSTTTRLCDRDRVNTTRPDTQERGWSPSFSLFGGTLKRGLQLGAALTLLAGFATAAESTNGPATTKSASSTPTRAETAPPRLDESAFRIIAERNIFNANRSGGQVRVASSRRPVRVETFTLVGTMAYEKGAFAFFEGTSSEFTKALKPDGIIAGHKLVDVYADSVKLEADGKEIELTIGSQMRREDEGAWHAAETATGEDSAGPGSDENNGRSRASSGRSKRGDRGGDFRSRRGNNSDSSGAAPAASSPSSNVDESEILKRLMERRAKESP